MFDNSGHSGNGGKNNKKRNDDGKSRFEGNAPDLMIVNFGLLGLFEMKELFFWEEVSMIVWASKNSDCFRYSVIFDTGHCLVTFWTDGGRSRYGI